MKKIEALKLSEVEPMPPWEREWVHWTEVPVVLKRLLNREVTKTSIYKWIKKGRNHQDKTQGRVFLAAHRKAGAVYVRVADLMAFLDAT